jgi:hypothetical protein
MSRWAVYEIVYEFGYGLVGVSVDGAEADRVNDSMNDAELAPIVGSWPGIGLAASAFMLS